MENNKYIPKYMIGDEVRLVKKRREFYCKTRIGSKGIIIKSDKDMFGICYFIQFKSHDNWIYEDQIELWNK